MKRDVKHAGTRGFRRHHVSEVTFGHVYQKPVLVDRSCGVDDSADGSASSSNVVTQPRFHLVDIGDIDTGGGHLGTQALNFSNRVDSRVMSVVVR